MSATDSKSAAEYREEQRVLQEAQQARRDLAHLPASADVFRASFQRWSEGWLASILRYAKEGDGGYRVCSGAAEEIAEAVAELMDAIRQAEIVFSEREREAQTTRYKARIAAGDPDFRSFMGALVPAHSE